MSFEQPNDCTYTQLDKSAPRSDLDQTVMINKITWRRDISIITTEAEEASMKE